MTTSPPVFCFSFSSRLWANGLGRAEPSTAAASGLWASSQRRLVGCGVARASVGFLKCYAHNNEISRLLLLPGQLGGPGAGFGLAQQILVGGGVEESRVAVFGHQHVDLALGQVEARRWGVLHVGFSDVTGFVVDVYLEKVKEHTNLVFFYFKKNQILVL